ncbi:MAG: type I secretion system permease/ATPase [Candidatus Sedimenticola sp. (ex Thyasira tokunagai)]
MDTPGNSKNKNLRDILGSLRKGFLQVGFFSMFINLMMLIPPLYMLQVYDRVLTSRSKETLLLLTLLLGWMFLTMGVLEFVRSRMMVRLSSRLDALLNRRLYRSVMQLSLSQPGEVGSQPLEDLSNIRQFISGSGIFAFFDAPWIPIYLAILFLFDSLFGLLALFAATLLGIFAIVNELSTRGLQRQSAEGQVAAMKAVDAQMRNAEVVRAMGMETALRERWFSAHAGSIKAQSKAADRAGVWVNLSKTLRLLFQSLMLGLGAYLAINNQITAGMVIAGSIILGRALSPIDQMIGVWKAFLGARMAYRRLDSLLEELPELPKRLSLPKPRGELAVDKAVLVPPGASDPALRGISFALRPGEAMAIIGGSAAGKSSLVRAMLGVWPLAAGSVCLDGAEIEQWNADELGPRIGYLPQDVELFDGTVAENIARFTDPEERRIIKAARIAGIDRMIRGLPDGYDTLIGQDGMSLSGGQRQRIGLARAVFNKPRLVVLDEPNSNLDRFGDKALSAACRYLKGKGVTLVIVSHRPEILKHVDKILVIEKGVQQVLGPRDEVLRHMGLPLPAPRRVQRAERRLHLATTAKAG